MPAPPGKQVALLGCPKAKGLPRVPSWLRVLWMRNRPPSDVRPLLAVAHRSWHQSLLGKPCSLKSPK